MREFQDICENVGSKAVTNTDKNKGAYVLNSEQKTVFAAAGYMPSDGGQNSTNLTLKVLNDAINHSLEVSYYNSIRVGTNRTPETRLGREVVHWMEVGDVLHFANIGRAIFVWKDSATILPLNETAAAVAGDVNAELILKKARQAKGKPSRKSKEISDYKRNVSVVAGALARAQGKCEMPSCENPTFQREDGSIYLEVHHIVPLAEGGDDTLINAAALCPSCHRELHYGQNRLPKRIILNDAIQSKEIKV